jgi:hypothetical protein
VAFTGIPEVIKVGRFVTRFTGVVLAAGAQGVIGFNRDSGAEVKLPVDFPDGTIRGLMLSDVVEVHSEVTSTGAVSVVKTDGPPFRITIANGGATQVQLEVYVKYLA